MKRQAYHHGDLKAALIKAGLRIIEDRTLDDLSLREVARAVGVSATAVYRHFPDKHALLAALSEVGYAMLHETQMTAAKNASSEKAAFNATGYAYVRFALDNPGLFRLIFSAGHATDMFAAEFEKQDSAMNMLRGYAEKLVPKGAPKTAAADFAVRAWSLVHGIAVLLLDKMIVLDDAAIRRIVDATHLLSAG
jgi:AcrR family transcriptional regulator